MAQLGGIILMDPDKDVDAQQNFFFGGIEGCKFRRPVVPGDTLVTPLSHSPPSLETQSPHPSSGYLKVLHTLQGCFRHAMHCDIHRHRFS